MDRELNSCGEGSWRYEGFLRVMAAICRGGTISLKTDEKMRRFTLHETLVIFGNICISHSAFWH